MSDPNYGGESGKPGCNAPLFSSLSVLPPMHRP